MFNGNDSTVDDRAFPEVDSTDRLAGRPIVVEWCMKMSDLRMHANKTALR